MEERWDIYDKNKQPTGRIMKRNDWTLKDDEYHLTVLGVIRRPDGKFLITKRVMTKAWAPGWWEVSGGAAQAADPGGLRGVQLPPALRQGTDSAGAGRGDGGHAHDGPAHHGGGDGSGHLSAG